MTFGLLFRMQKKLPHTINHGTGFYFKL